MTLVMELHTLALGRFQLSVTASAKAAISSSTPTARQSPLLRVIPWIRRGGRLDLPVAARPRVPVPDPELLAYTPPAAPMLGSLEEMLAVQSAADGAACPGDDDAAWPGDGAPWPGDDVAWPGDELAARRRARDEGPVPGLPGYSVASPWRQLTPPGSGAAWPQQRPGDDEPG